jgi:hypothetical protein
VDVDVDTDVDVDVDVDVDADMDMAMYGEVESGHGKLGCQNSEQELSQAALWLSGTASHEKVL